MLYQGSTYYISTSPSSEYWENDFKTMKGKGMNIVKHLVVWEDVELDDGIFNFSTIHKLLETTEKYELDVLLELRLKNRGFPRWFLEKYPDSIPITADGTWRASGACYNHPKYQEYSVRFIENTVKELKKYKYIKIWDIWNEPHLYSAGDNSDAPQQQQCYCSYCQKGFKEWLSANPQYVKSVTSDGWQGINTSGMGFYNDYRYRLYFINKVMVSEAKRLYSAVRRFDDRSIALHDVYVSPLGSIQSIGNDDWQLANCVDIYGVTCGHVLMGVECGKRFYHIPPFIYDETRSASNNKPWLLSEWHVTGGSFGISKRINRDFKEIKREYFEALVRGCSGLITWSYRNFSNNFCMVDIYNRNTTTYEHISIISKRLRELNHFDTMKTRTPEAAILFDPVNVLKYWETFGESEFINSGSEGIYRYLYDSDVMVDFIHPLAMNNISQYKTVFIPCPLNLSRDALEKLKEYVNDGGTIISEGLFSFLDGLEYSREGNIPHGFAEVFGVKIADISNPTFMNEPADMIVYNEYGNKIVMTYSHNYEILSPVTAKVLLYNAEGQTICTENFYGKGKAILCASLFTPHIVQQKVMPVAEAGRMVINSIIAPEKELPDNYDLLDFLFTQAGWCLGKPKGVRIDIFGDLEVVTNESGTDYTYKPDKPRTEIFTGETAEYENGIVIKNEDTAVFL